MALNGKDPSRPAPGVAVEDDKTPSRDRARVRCIAPAPTCLVPRLQACQAGGAQASVFRDWQSEARETSGAKRIVVVFDPGQSLFALHPTLEGSADATRSPPFLPCLTAQCYATPSKALGRNILDSQLRTGTETSTTTSIAL